jgi:hypothetical protein
VHTSTDRQMSTLVCTTPANRRSAVRTTSDIDKGHPVLCGAALFGGPAVAAGVVAAQESRGQVAHDEKVEQQGANLECGGFGDELDVIGSVHHRGW